jgi:hypothetical protein
MPSSNEERISPEDREEADQRRWRHYDAIVNGRQDRWENAWEQMERNLLLDEEPDETEEN